MHFTDWEEPAHALHRWGGAGSCMPPGVWGWVGDPAPVLYRLGGAGSCVIPPGRSRLLYFTDWEEPAYMCSTEWEEPASVLH